jgi:cholesterol transport system auxiliary component
VLHIRRVSATTDLATRIAFGDGAYEVGYYEQRRWTESPDLYVRRALDRALCQERAFRCDGEGDAALLEVDVLRFQEVKTEKAHSALVSLRVVLTTDRPLLDDTIQVVEPVDGTSFDDVVAAIGRALDEAADRVANRVGSQLSERGQGPPKSGARTPHFPQWRST